MNPFDIEGKVALVTGANRGIGRAIVESFLGHGAAKVYAAVRNPASARPLVERFADRVVPVELDLSKDDTVRAATRPAADVEVVVNNAGVLRTSNPFADDVHEALDFEMDVNVHGLLRVARAFAPVLGTNGGGAFVQVNSVVSMKAFPDMATYCASKAAAYSITQSLRPRLAEQGTQVYSVHPGPIATDMGEAAGVADIAEPPSLVAEAIVKAFRNATFHVWADSISREIGSAYDDFAEQVIEGEDS